VKRWQKILLTIGFLLIATPILLMLVFPTVVFEMLGYEGRRVGSPFAEAHERAITSFAHQVGFGVARFQKKQFWNDASVMHLGREYWVDSINLIGDSDEGVPQRYGNHFPPVK